MTMDVVDEVVQCINRGDVEGQLALGSDDCTARFEDMPDMPWAAYVKANADLSASFPDFSISGFKKVVSGNKISLVDCVVAGTHTGVPFGLPNTPGCPKIKATDITALNDPETLEFTIEDGKITSFRAIAFGEKTGPPGFYNQVAGLVF
jgi:ketosteroid isomerase-like protein